MLHTSTFAQLVHPLRRRERTPAPGALQAVLIRPASAADEQELARLVALEERELPHGERLIGELEGRVVAAVDVDSGTAVADPFVPTAGIVEMLGLRAAQVRR